jgi:hypothetical protein
MRKTCSSLLIVAFFSTLSLGQQAEPRYFDGKSWWDHVKVLANDKMEGRDTGSAGEKKAQEYAIEQFKAAGLAPAGTDGFYQPVKFVSRQIVEKDSSLALVRGGKTERVHLGDDAILSARVEPAPEVNAPLVFVGYGLKIPDTNIDDFAGTRCERQSCSSHNRLAIQRARSALRPRAVAPRTVEWAESCGGHWLHFDSESRISGSSVGANCAQSDTSVDGPRLS